MKVRFAAFLQPVELPGRSMANHVHEFAADHPERGGFELSLVELLGGHLFLRVSVPEGPYARRVGAWMEDGRPLYGLGRTCYIPKELVKKVELAKDAAEDLAAAKKTKLPGPTPPA